MDLPVMPPVSPMLAKSVPDLPHVGHFEPKWDGFRAVVFRDGDEVEIGSRNERTLTRYFPELVEAVKEQLPARCVVDGEIVVPDASGQGLDFEALLERIHPAESRVRLLASITPAHFVVFDLLSLGSRDLRGERFSLRRALLVESMADAGHTIHLTRATPDMDVARQWFFMFEGAGLDGIVAKALDQPYAEGKRVMFKVKHDRRADCVVGGFRWHKGGGESVGSLLLGLYDEDGVLHHVGVSSSFSSARRCQLVGELAPYRMSCLEGHPWAWTEAKQKQPRRVPGARSRWSANRSPAFEPVVPQLVCEVAYDHMEGPRFRHSARFVRWRFDRDPRSCTYEQLERPVRFGLADVLGSSETWCAKPATATSEDG